MKQIRKLIPFLLALLVMACETEDATLAGEWQETERIDPDNPDIAIATRDTSIVFYPDGRFEGIMINPYTYYSVIDERILALEDENRRRIHLYSYSIKGNKLTLRMDSGAVVYPLPGFPIASPIIFKYKKIKDTAP